MFRTKQPATPADAAVDFGAALDALIATAMKAHVGMRQLADVMEQKSQQLRRQFAVTAPL